MTFDSTDEAVIAHDTYLHMYNLAQSCVTANMGDNVRFRAHCEVRDFCAGRMRLVVINAMLSGMRIGRKGKVK